MKNFLNNNRSMQLIVVTAMIFVGNLFSMRMTEQGKNAAQKMMKELQQQQQQPKLQQEREKQYQAGKYFVFQKDTSKGILVDQTLLEGNSEMVKSMIEDLGGSRPQEIFMPFSFDNIKLAFDVMDKKINAAKLSSDQLVNVINCYDYLLVKIINTDLIDAVVARINYIGYQIMDEGNIPDYTVFGKIQDPSVVKIIIDKVFSTQNKFYNDLVNFYSNWYRYSVGMTAQREVQSKFGGMTSISAMLDKIEKFFSSISQAREEREYFG